jgi:hypothetical protein
MAQSQPQAPVGNTCQERMLALAQRASALAARADEHNRFALDHAEKYKLEIQTCELAKKANTRQQLEACLLLLDKAEQRAAKGNKLAEALSRESTELKAASSAHNKSCPAHQVLVVQQ